MLEIPGVVLDRVVGRELQMHLLADRQQLAARAHVDERGQVAVEVPVHGDQPVGEAVLGDVHVVLDCLRDERREPEGSHLGEERRGAVGEALHRAFTLGCERAGHDLAACLARGVGQRRAGHQALHRLGDHLLQAGRDSRVRRLGVVVDPGD